MSEEKKSFRSLQSDEISSLINKVPKKASDKAREVDSTPPHERWPTPADRAILVNEGRKGEQLIKLSDGKKYVVRYQDDGDTIFIKYVHHFVPCGWFKLSTLEAELLEAEQAVV